MKTTRYVTTGLIVASLAASVAIAAGHGKSPEEKIIAARKAQMHLMAHNLGILGAMANGATDYNEDAANAAAGNLKALAGLNPMSMYTADTDSMSVDGTRAMPDLWDNMDDVASKFTSLGTATSALADAAGGGLEGLQGAIGGVGKVCGDCHKAYREPAS
ncbi:MAG TPA: cytochrome c [Aliiroseovarius sp.]|nr:cytochrome c [Aliiroseovarius sp.]